MGHVDEIISFVSAEPAAVVASPRLAVDIMHFLEIGGHGDSTIRCGAPGFPERNVSVEELLIDIDLGSKAPKKTSLTATTQPGATTISVGVNCFAVGDYLRIDNEFFLVTGTGAGLTVVPGQLASPERSHSSGTIVYALSRIVRDNIAGYKLGGHPRLSAQASIDKCVQQLESGMEMKINQRPVPVLFFRDEALRVFNALSVDLANCFVGEGIAIMGDPYGPQLNGVDLFRRFADAAMSGYLYPKYMQSSMILGPWILHMNGGDVHCGSNVRRNIARLDWWNAWK